MPGWDYKGLWVYSQPVVGVPSLLPWLVARPRLHTSERVELVYPFFGAVWEKTLAQVPLRICLL